MDSEDAFKKRFLKSLLQAVLMVLAGIALGAAFNSLRPDRLPWVGASPSPRAEAAIPTMGVMEAWREYQKGLVLFVDARSSSEYEAGHLPGALSVPLETVEGKAGRVKLPEGRALVIYCSDTACPKSGQLATLLSGQGVKGIRVMPGGWAGWYEAGLPSEGKGEG